MCETWDTKAVQFHNKRLRSINCKLNLSPGPSFIDWNCWFFNLCTLSLVGTRCVRGLDKPFKTISTSHTTSPLSRLNFVYTSQVLADQEWVVVPFALWTRNVIILCNSFLCCKVSKPNRGPTQDKPEWIPWHIYWYWITVKSGTLSAPDCVWLNILRWLTMRPLPDFPV